jgi:hypothetical protein
MKITRRQFIKRISAGAFVVGANPLLSACGGITRNDLISDQHPDGYLFGLDEMDVKILIYASLAPSALNVQPWFVRVVDRQRQWIIGADPRRSLPAIDPDNRETLLSIGAFVENLFIAASAMGLHADFEIIARTPFDPEIIRVKFSKVPKVDYPLKRLSSRRTVKKGFLQKELRTETINALSAPIKDSFFYSPKGTAHATCIRDGLLEEYRNQLQRDAAQMEISSWIRLSDDDAKKYRDGLTLEGMEICGIPGWYLRHFAEPPDFMKPGYRKKSLDYTAALANEGAGWVIITSDGNDVSHLIDTGRKFEQMALKAREHNVAIHPMNQYLEEKSGMDMIRMSHEKDIIPQFILRVGYLYDYPPPVSLRRSLCWFLRA